MGELLFILSLIIFLIAPFVIGGLWVWVFCMSTIGLVVILYEIYGRFFTPEKRTISRMFWDWSTAKDDAGKYKNRWKAWMILGLLQLGWLSLLLHLGWRMLTG